MCGQVLGLGRLPTGMKTSNEAREIVDIGNNFIAVKKAMDVGTTGV